MLRGSGVLLVLLASACSDDASGPDAACKQFTGGYIEWDSTESLFAGINEATVTEVAHPDNTATTAPNGRSDLCIDDAPGEVTWTKTDYLTTRYTIDPDAVLGPYELRGIPEARVFDIHDGQFGVLYDNTRVL